MQPSPENVLEDDDAVLSTNAHDLVRFMLQNGDQIKSEYQRIRARALEDSGTAGDEGEENWADLFRNWLPSTYNIVTKGRILSSTGKATPQVDVLVLRPDYPRALLNKKYYLSAGVVAAFECKNTLDRGGLKKTIINSKKIAEILHSEIHETKGYRHELQCQNPIFAELHKPLVYGLLAHSQNWAESTAKETITHLLMELDAETTMHPRELLDILCVADVAVWSAGRTATQIVPVGKEFSIAPICTTTYSCLHQDQ